MINGDGKIVLSFDITGVKNQAYILSAVKL